MMRCSTATYIVQSTAKYNWKWLQMIHFSVWFIIQQNGYDQIYIGKLATYKIKYYFWMIIFAVEYIVLLPFLPHSNIFPVVLRVKQYG